MEDLEAHQKIIDLGKSIVKNLDLDPGVDTLSKWMAHYLAEKIELSEKLTGSRKTKAEQECFEIILKLWENRWSVPPLRDYLKQFTPLLDTLKKLNPDKKGSFFFPERVAIFLEEESKIDKTSKVMDHLDIALKVDKLARSIISDLLRQAASRLALNDEKSEYIRNAIELVDYPDTRIIQFTANYDDLKRQAEEPNEIKEKIQKLQATINDLEEFTLIRDALLKRYTTELEDFKKRLK